MRRPPYLPFLNGPPEFVVGLKPIALDAWLRPDIEAAHLPEKRALIDSRRDEVFRATPKSEAAQREVATLVGADLGAPYAETGEAPLLHAARLVSDDLAVMARHGEDWRAIALVLCSPTFFSAAHAIGKSLWALHVPVPDRLGPEGAQGLSARIGRVFAMLREDNVLERFNWTVQAGPGRFTPDGAPLRARAASAAESEALDLLHLRVERQTIRALPQTGTILFTIRVSLDPLRAVFAEPGAREALAHAWRNAPAHVRAYKKWDAYERLVQAALTQA